MNNTYEEEVVCYTIARYIKEGKIDRATLELEAYGMGRYQEGQFDARESGGAQT